MAWHWLQYVLGFKKLGHDVYFVEELAPEWCFTRLGKPCSYDDSFNQHVFRELMGRFGLLERACQLYNQGEATTGLSLTELKGVVQGADVLINMSGHARSDFILESSKHRVYVDQDPVYTQLWHDEYGKDLNFPQHDSFFTVGLNIGTVHTPIPDCGIQWNHLLPPVIPELWGCAAGTASGRFTTIASWFGYNDLLYQGEWYRSKYVEFERFASLPARVDQQLEVALKTYRADDPGIRLLREGGWIISDASRSDTLENYQAFIQRSRAEIGIAQNAYVKGRSGWFSDRSSHYLVSGKPVLAQATGFERLLPVGEGLLVFSSLDEAAEGVNRIDRDYALHSRAAREFARNYLDYTVVLPKLLEDCFATPSVSGSHVK
jgi:hypothetical protein